MTGGPCAVLLRVRVLDEPDTQPQYSTLVCEALAEHLQRKCGRNHNAPSDDGGGRDSREDNPIRRADHLAQGDGPMERGQVPAGEVIGEVGCQT